MSKLEIVPALPPMIFCEFIVQWDKKSRDYGCCGNPAKPYRVKGKIGYTVMNLCGVCRLKMLGQKDVHKNFTRWEIEEIT